MLRKGVAANFAGQAYTGLLSLAVVPFYLWYLGLEAYGLIGFFTSLQAILAVLDFGLSATANREMAQQSARGRSGSAGDVVRTLEVTYFGVGTTIAAALLGLSGVLAGQWFKPEALTTSEIQLAVAIFGVTVGLRWPVSMYTGVLRGLERHVLINQMSAALATLRSVGGVAVLVFVAPTVTVFLLWQLLVAAVELMFTRTSAWRALPRVAGASRRFNAGALRATWRFSAGVAMIGISAAVLKQMDRMLISKLLPLEMLGYYTTAAVIAGNVALLFAPISSAVFPRLSKLWATRDSAGLASVYHKSVRVTALIVAPVCALLMFFSYDVLFLWTRSEDVAAQAAAPLAILAYASLLNSLMHVPYALQLAAGLTRIAVWNNGLSVAVLLPLLYLLVNRYGITGGALGWAIFNTSYFLIMPAVMHRHVLVGHLKTWVLRDTLPFIATAVALFGAARLGATMIGGGVADYGAVIVAGLAYAAIVAVAFADDLPTLRAAVTH